jgi:hypothetical protein
LDSSPRTKAEEGAASDLQEVVEIEQPAWDGHKLAEYAWSCPDTAEQFIELHHGQVACSAGNWT